MTNTSVIGDQAQLSLISGYSRPKGEKQMYDTPAEKLAGIIAADLVEYEEQPFYPWDTGDKPFGVEISREKLFVTADDGEKTRHFVVEVTEYEMDRDPVGAVINAIFNGEWDWTVGMVCELRSELNRRLDHIKRECEAKGLDWQEIGDDEITNWK